MFQLFSSSSTTTPSSHSIIIFWNLTFENVQWWKVYHHTQLIQHHHHHLNLEKSQTNSTDVTLCSRKKHDHQSGYYPWLHVLPMCFIVFVNQIRQNFCHNASKAKSLQWFGIHCKSENLSTQILCSKKRKSENLSTQILCSKKRETHSVARLRGERTSNKMSQTKKIALGCLAAATAAAGYAYTINRFLHQILINLIGNQFRLKSSLSRTLLNKPTGWALWMAEKVDGGWWRRCNFLFLKNLLRIKDIAS